MCPDDKASLTIYQQIHLKYEISHLAELRQSFLEALDVLLGDHYEPLFPPVYSNIFLSQFKFNIFLVAPAEQLPLLHPHEAAVEWEGGGGVGVGWGALSCQ